MKRPLARDWIASGERKIWLFSFGVVRPHSVDKIRLRRGEGGDTAALVHQRHLSALAVYSITHQHNELVEISFEKIQHVLR